MFICSFYAYMRVIYLGTRRDVYLYLRDRANIIQCDFLQINTPYTKVCGTKINFPIYHGTYIFLARGILMAAGSESAIYVYAYMYLKYLYGWWWKKLHGSGVECLNKKHWRFLSIFFFFFFLCFLNALIVDDAFTRRAVIPINITHFGDIRRRYAAFVSALY